MSVISDIKMILENASPVCITDAKTYTEQKARLRDAKNYVCEMEVVKADAIRELKQRFRNEYEEMMELEMEDCINWADWLDATAEQILADRKG